GLQDCLADIEQDVAAEREHPALVRLLGLEALELAFEPLDFLCGALLLLHRLLASLLGLGLRAARRGLRLLLLLGKLLGARTGDYVLALQIGLLDLAARGAGRRRLRRDPGLLLRKVCLMRDVVGIFAAR